MMKYFIMGEIAVAIPIIVWKLSTAVSYLEIIAGRF